MDDEDYFKQYIRDVPDFPKKGIVFKDITPLLRDLGAFNKSISKILERFSQEEINIVACIEARGFLLGSALAYNLGAGLVPIRKVGKLPWEINKACYELEYGTDTLEIHKDAISPGQRVLLVDDVLATGGTAKAAIDIIGNMGGNIVCAAFLLELSELAGRKKTENTAVYSLIRY
ncbi:adenine phosphoribosyltransferase [Chloroflexota bacterium]